jgi:sugar phosphate isomerase/epimerase
MRDLRGHLEHCAINTACFGFRDPLPNVIDAVARAGFGGISIWRREVDGYDIKMLARRLRDAGLKVTGYCRSTPLVTKSDAAFHNSMAENARAMSDGKALGAQFYAFVVGGVSDGTGDIAHSRMQVREGLAHLLQHGHSIDLKLAVEPLNPVYVVDRSVITRLSEALDLCDSIEGSVTTPQIGVLIDVYHTFWDVDVHQQIMRAGQAHRIFGFHVNDWLNPTQDVLNDRGMMGDGVIDLRGFRAVIERAGYQGLVEAEIFSDQNWWRKPMAETLQVLAERFQTVV